MRNTLPLPSLCVATVLSLMVIPARISAQTPESGPLLDIGPLVNQFAAVADGVFAETLVGARASVRLSPTVSAQFDLRFVASSLTDGLYTMRLRFMPRADSSSWYLFAGPGGTFQLPDARSYPAQGAAPAFSYKRPGKIGPPMLLHGGAGWRFAGHRSWSSAIEGEAWTSWDGGAAVGATFAVSYGR